MNEFNIIGITGIILIGILAQWLGWRLRIPAILLLSAAGIIVGPVTGVLNPETIFGDSLFALISLAVAIVLFEGGLSLRLKDLDDIRQSVVNLVSIGVLITWSTAAFGAWFFLKLEFRLALLLGAILVVTGPTVIIPMLNHLRLVSRVGAAARWEGIINDPIGALLSVLIFEILMGSGFGIIPEIAVSGILKTVLIGSGLAFGASYIVTTSIRNYWIPDQLQNPVIIMLVLTVFTVANYIQPESGLFAVTVMGISVANQKSISIKHIIEFKENLRVLLISSLFMILIARLQPSDINQISWSVILFLLFLVLVSRPLAVYFSTINLTYTWKERLFLSFMAPRGIVAASVASLFAIELVKNGYDEAGLLVPYTFTVILGTVAIYGLLAPVLARALGLSQRKPQGTLIIGAHHWARQLAKCLHAEGFSVLLVDTNYKNISTAKLMGLPAYYGNILAESIFDELDLTGLGKLIAITPNEEVNNLAALHFQEIFGRVEVYQLPSPSDQTDGKPVVSSHLRGRVLFGTEYGYENLNRYSENGALIKTTEITPEFDFEQYRQHYDRLAIPMFLITDKNEIQVFSSDNQPQPLAGMLLISMVYE